MHKTWNLVQSYTFNIILLSLSLGLLFLMIVMKVQGESTKTFQPVISYPDSFGPILKEKDLPVLDLNWAPPHVVIKRANQTLKYRHTEVKVQSNKQLSAVKIPANWHFNYAVGEAPDIYEYVITTGDIVDGQHTYSLILKDKNDNKVEFDVSLVAPANRPTAPGWAGTNFFGDPDSLTAIANKSYRLSMFYEPKDLVKVGDYEINNYNEARVRKIVIEDLKQMTEAIKKAGIDYKVTSGYRSYDSQVSVYNYWLDLSDGNVAYTDTFSARPGHSEHQLGTTVDFLTNESNDTFADFESTRLAKWLAENAHKYGFVISYPKGKTDITGYSFEPWHYRYVGRNNAKLIKESKLTLTEWLYQLYDIKS